MFHDHRTTLRDTAQQVELLLELVQICAAEVDAATAARWESYATSPAARHALAGEPVFEPIQLLRPSAGGPRGVQGFEVLARDCEGRSYGILLRTALAAGVEQLDLDLFLLMSHLRTIRALRQHLQERFGPEILKLFFSLNLTADMLRAPMFPVILDHFFDPLMAHAIPFELSERFPGGGADMSDPFTRLRTTQQALGDLLFLQGSYGLHFILDDSDRLDHGVRAALKGIAIKTKIDAQTTKSIFSFSRFHGMTTQDLIDELERYRVRGKPLVIEGVETEEQMHLLRDTLDAGYQTAAQGWAVTLDDSLLECFEPCNMALKTQPRGYRLNRVTREAVCV